MTDRDDAAAAEAIAELRALADDRIEEKAALPGAVLDVDHRDVTTLFSTDAIDSVGDITLPSAFRRSISHRAERIPHLYMHQIDQAPLAKIMSFAEITRSQLPEDVQSEYPDATGGVTCVSRFLKTPRAEEVLQGIKEGIPFGASFGYIVTKHGRKLLPDGRQGRVLEEVRLLEVSTTAPNMAANASSRTRLGKALALLEELKTGRRHSGRDVDFLNQIATLILELGATNITLLDEGPAPQAEPARTPETDALMAELASIFEVVT